MKKQSIDISDLIAEVTEDCANKANQIHNEKPSEPKTEPQETLEQLESSWRMANKKVEEENHPKLKYQDKSAPFIKKEEVLDYWRNHTVSEPYINVIMENCFGIPHEVIYDYEAEYMKMGKIPVRPSWIDKLYRRVELWGRVLATLEYNKIETPDPEFKSFAEYKRMEALREVSEINARREKREMEESENNVRKSFRRRGDWK